VAALALGAGLVWVLPSDAFNPTTSGQEGAAGGSRQPLPYNIPPPPPSSPSLASLGQAVQAEEYAFHRQTGQYIPATQDNLLALIAFRQ
jgi:hypothetical protein